MQYDNGVVTARLWSQFPHLQNDHIEPEGGRNLSLLTALILLELGERQRGKFPLSQETFSCG